MKHYNLLFFLLTFLFFRPSTAQAQTLQPSWRFTHLTSEDGLPINEITALEQDQQGFIWLGTNLGLVRYDGYKMVVYQQQPGNPQTIRNNQIRDIFEDSQGMLWIATFPNGVSRFNPYTERFTHYNNILRGPAHIIFEDDQGIFWLGGGPRVGFARLDLTNQEAIVYVSESDGLAEAPPPPSMPTDAPPAGPPPGGPTPPLNITTRPGNFSGSVWNITQDPAGDIWFTTDGQLVQLNPQTEQFTTYTPPVPERRLANLEQDAIGRFWIGGDAGVYQFDPATKLFTHYPTSPSGINDLLLNEDGSLWLATLRAGLVRFDPRQNQVVQQFTTNPADPHSLSDNRLNTLLRDREQLLWIGTATAGVNILNPRQQIFTFYRPEVDNPASLARPSVTALAYNQQTLWLGTEHILNKVALDTNQVTHYPLPMGENGRFPTIYALLLHDNFVWLGLSGIQLARFNTQTAEFTFYPLLPPTDEPPPPGAPPSITALAGDPAGYLWVAVSRLGVFQLNPDGEMVNQWLGKRGNAPDLEDSSGLQSDNPEMLHLDGRGRVWIGDSKGLLSLLDPTTQQFTHYALLPGTQVYDLFEDQTGRMWLGTSMGLFCFDPITEQFTHYTTAEGLPSPLVTALEQDRAGYLWVSTKKGLARLDMRQNSWQVYQRGDGLQALEFNRAAVVEDNTGRLYFGSTTGLTSFYPDQLVAEKEPAAVAFTDFRLFNQPVPVGENGVLAQSITHATELDLSYDQNMLSFEFSALSYADPQNIRYQYRLAGLEEEWNEVDSGRRFVTYSSLPAGSYTLQVRASQPGGGWGEPTLTLPITITPPWWQTTWFRVLLFIGFIGVILGVYQWRVYAMIQQNKLLEQLVTERTAKLVSSEAKVAAMEERERIGRELHDDLGQIIGYLNVQAQAAKNLLHQEQLAPAETALAQLAEVAQEAHQNIRQYILGVRSEPAPPPADFFSALTHYLEQLKNRYNFTVQLSLPNEWLTSPLLPDVENQLLRVIQEALNNARKYAGVSQAQLLFTLHADEVQVIIADDGRGFDVDHPAADNLPHFGLTIMRERLESVGGRLEIRSNPAGGTQIIARLPRLLAALEEENIQGIRVLLVDDHPLYLEGLRNLLSAKGLMVVGQARNGLEAQELAQQLSPDLILMDVEMPVCDGLEATRLIKEKLPHLKIVMLTVAADEEKLFTALQNGASGYLLKSLDSTKFFNLLSEVMRGETVLSPKLAAQVLSKFSQKETSLPPAAPTTPAEVTPTLTDTPTLTTRQLDVLQLVAQGLTNKEIADLLHISERTVKFHVSQILEQLQLRSRYELASYAKQQRLTSTDN